jgi:hypothetical protein
MNSILLIDNLLVYFNRYNLQLPYYAAHGRGLLNQARSARLLRRGGTPTKHRLIFYDGERLEPPM